MAPLGSTKAPAERVQLGPIVASNRSTHDISKGIKGRGYDKPPLPTKIGLDTTLNLSNVPIGKLHGPGLSSSIRTIGGTSRTLRGPQRTLRVQHDCDTLAAFLRRERDFAQQRRSTCKYPWCEDASIPESKMNASCVPQIKIQPMDGYDAWEESMQAQLNMRRRVFMEGATPGSQARSMSIPDSPIHRQQQRVSIGCGFMQ